jgi:NCS1 family nucleobase:cation symporter-1
MCSLTIVSGMSGARSFSTKARSLVIVLFIALSVVLAVFASHDFLSNFKNFVLLLLVAFVPWSAVNLIDYYLISCEKVDIPALYLPDGRYGTQLAGARELRVGILSQVPFINQAMYTGFAVKLLGNTDISWIVGLLVTTFVYYPWAKRTTRPGADGLLDSLTPC